ncbi:hypothetical protein CGCSCA1_v014737 [Colletotrichum siamense]|nr:hypothetical protein CGCSCA1_v014737 [Colletotrichum siamense]
MVHLDYLSTVVWNEVRLDHSDEKVCLQIASIFQNFQQFTEFPTMLERRPTGQSIIIIRGDMVRATSIMEAVAERDKRALFEMDLLDLVRTEYTFFEDIRRRLLRVERLQGLVLLQNFASLIKSRSYDERRRCSEITRFIEILEVYPEIVIICLEKGETVDWKLKRLGPVYVDLDDVAE